MSGNSTQNSNNRALSWSLPTWKVYIEVCQFKTIPKEKPTLIICKDEKLSRISSSIIPITGFVSVGGRCIHCFLYNWREDSTSYTGEWAFLYIHPSFPVNSTDWHWMSGDVFVRTTPFSISLQNKKKHIISKVRRHFLSEKTTKTHRNNISMETNEILWNRFDYVMVIYVTVTRARHHTSSIDTIDIQLERKLLSLLLKSLHLVF